MGLPFNNPDVTVQSWYVVARSRDLGPQQAIARTLLQHRLALYRDADGHVHALAGRCRHLGANLGYGSVMGGHLRCPFHHWTYATDGRCVAIPGLASVPPDTRTFAYPTVEQYGALWIFNGPQPLFPVPSFDGWQEDALVVVALPPQVLHCHPHVIACNGLDVQHFQTVHQLTFVTAPVVEVLDDYRIRVQLHIRLSGKNVFAKVLRSVVGETVSATFTTWGGNLATIDGQLGSYPLLVLFTHRPLPEGKSASQTFLFMPKGSRMRQLSGLNVLLVLVARLLMGHIVVRDRALLDTLQFRANFVSSDAPLLAFIEQVNRMQVFEAPQ